ncbi:hypothetical protein P3T76_006599 [Phytophthora citrophthora]|uniref:RRM domain-containing protein n=1 Tax=Phytophthora citrophthora TaxID=4793 RepID=A0AAD9LP03_9STRA|nr:hypothetical protein P3T76_006599 [Phytophthora citrophthora]
MGDSAAALWESELLRARDWLAATRTDKQQEHLQLFTRVKAHIAYKDHQRSLQSEAIASEDEDDTALDFLADVDASDMSALLQAEAAKAAPTVEDMLPVESVMPSAKDLMRPLDMPNNLASPKLKPKVKAVPMSQLDPKTLRSSTTASVTAGATLGADEEVQKLMVSLDVTLPMHSDNEETKTEESTPPHLLKSFGGESKAGNLGLHVSGSWKLEQLKYMQQASSKSPQDPHKKKTTISATTKQDDDVTREMLSWVTGCRDPEVIKRKENLRRKRKHPHRYGMASEEEQRQVLMKAKRIARDSDNESEDDFSSDYSPAEDDEMPEPDEPEVVDLLSDDYLDSDDDKRPAKRKRKRLRQTNTSAKKKKVRSRKPAVTRKLSQPDSSSESTPPPSHMEMRDIPAASEASQTPAMTKSASTEKLIDGVTGKSNHPIELLSSDDESDKVIISKNVGIRAEHELHDENLVSAESTKATPSIARTVVYKPAADEVSKSDELGRVQESEVLNTAMQSSDVDGDDADISDTGTIDLEEEDLSLGAEDNEDIATNDDVSNLDCHNEQGEHEADAGKKPCVMTEEVVSAIESEEKTNQEQTTVQADNGAKQSENTTDKVLPNAEVDDEDVSEAETEILDDDDEPDTDDLGLDYSDDSDSGGNLARNGNNTTGAQKDGAVSSDKNISEAHDSSGKKENTPDSSNAGVQQFFDFKPLKLKPKANATTTAPKPLPVHTYSETHAKTGGGELENTGDRQKSPVTPAKPTGSNGLRPSKKPIATTTTFKGKYAVTRRSTKMLNPGDTPGAKRQAKSQYSMVPTKKVSSARDLDDVPLALLAKELQKKPDDNPQTKYLLYAGAKKTEDVPTFTADTSRVAPKSRFGGGNSSFNANASAKSDYQAPLTGRQSLVNGKNAPQQGGYRREPQISIYDALHMDGQESASDIRDGTGYKRSSRFKKMQEEAARNGTPMVKSRLQNTDWDKIPIPRKLPQAEKSTRDAVLPSPPNKNDYGSRNVGNTPNKRRKKNSGSSNKNSGPSYYGPQASKPETKGRYDSPSRGIRGRELNNYRREDDRWRKRSASPPSRDRDRHDRREDRKRRGSSRSRSRSVSPRGRDYSSSRRHQGSRSRSWSRERSSERDSRRTERSGSSYRDRDRQSNGSLFSDGHDSTKKGSNELPELGEVRQNGKLEHADNSVKKQKSSAVMEAPASSGALATFDDDGDNIYISDSDDDEKNLIKEVEDIRFDLDGVAVDEALMSKQVYVTGLNPTLVAEQIEEDFARFGVAVDRETGFPAIDLFPSQRNHLCRGDACVTFETEDGAQEAAEELNAKNVKNSMIRVKRMDIHTLRILNVQFQTVRDTWRCTETRCRADVSIWTGKCDKCGRKRVYAPSNVKIGAESWLCSLCVLRCICILPIFRFLRCATVLMSKLFYSERLIRYKLSRLQGIVARGRPLDALHVLISLEYLSERIPHGWRKRCKMQWPQTTRCSREGDGSS